MGLRSTQFKSDVNRLQKDQRATRKRMQTEPMTEGLSRKYGDFFEQGMQLRADAGEPAVAQLRQDKVPKELWPLLPYAEFWGISDDSYRITLISRAPTGIWSDFREAVSKQLPALLEWLAGPESEAAHSPEYVAFSFMLQAFDSPRK